MKDGINPDTHVIWSMFSYCSRNWSWWKNCETFYN